jgi:hypothetical protein
MSRKQFNYIGLVLIACFLMVLVGQATRSFVLFAHAHPLLQINPTHPPITATGPPPAPPVVLPASFWNPSSTVITDPIDPSTAMATITVTANNWREVQVRLNNLFTDPSVLRLRREALGKFVLRMEDADRQTIWAQRDAMRKAAVKDLASSENDFRQLVSGGPPARRDEAAVALLEIQWMAGEPKAVVAGALLLAKRLGPGPLRDQAYYYLIQGASGVPDVVKSKQYLAEFREVNSDATNRFFGPMPPLGLLRRMAFLFQFAQLDDDIALEFPGTAPGATGASMRDSTRLDAAELYKDFKDMRMPARGQTRP